ncbi:hypothetical protein Bbelb_239850 [Branchiostoma belcheri]|nr:hypothetical protein Bbelb_239850 [Branchiostoma belcheri]
MRGADGEAGESCLSHSRPCGTTEGHRSRHIGALSSGLETDKSLCDLPLAVWSQADARRSPESQDPHGLPYYQLAEIKKTSLARILCDNTDTEQMQPNVFKQHTQPGNERMACTDLPIVDLSKWYMQE